MSSIEIRKIGITDLDTDAIVNAASEGLWEGGGVCGAIFRGAGSREMTEACSKYGHCDTGKAVITPGFALKAKHVIHAVGPIWRGGDQGEPELLYDAYMNTLKLARDNGCHTLGFPLISSGIYGYPMEQAWDRAIAACKDFIRDNKDYEMDIVFAVLDDGVKACGEKVMQRGKYGSC